MDKLDDVGADALRAALDDATDPKAVRRLMVALAYKDGVAVDTLADRYGIPRSTIYAWLERLEERPIDEAIRDDHRPGRPAELDEADRERLAEVLAEPPTAHGFDGETWTPDLVRRFVDDAFDVEYSLGHARRLLRTYGEPG